MTPAASPPARAEHGLCYDIARDRVVLFGGRDTGILGDTWEWDGVAWRQLHPASSPGPRAGHTLVYDAARCLAVLEGGVDAVGNGIGGTWEFDGTDWVRRTPVTGPVPQGWHAATFDEVRARVVWFGLDGTFGPSGAGSTWVYGPTRPATVVPIGLGCGGSTGVLSLAFARGALPWIGDVLTLELGALASGSLPIAVFGASRTRWGNTALPLSLQFLGSHGCWLLTDPLVVAPMASSAGRAWLDFRLPSQASLMRVPFYTQGFATDPAANFAGLVSSNGLEVRPGSR